MIKAINRMSSRGQKGFTLIELLVVIAIIGILSSIILASLNTARAQARDARRISDIKQLQLALELYYDSCGVFPEYIYGSNASANYCNTTGTNTNGLVANNFISQVPTDPNGPNYNYVPLTTNGPATCLSQGATSYHLGSTLETGNSNLQSDTDATKSGNACSGFTDFYGLAYGANSAGAPYCSGTAGNAYPNSSNQETCYDVTP